MIKSPQILHDYQKRAIRHVLAHKQSMLWLDMGLGKTVTTLTAISHLLDCFEIRGALVVGPLRVIQTVWKKEAAGWSHLNHLSFSTIHGNPQTRHRAVCRQADIYLVNYENLPWLVNELTVVYLSRGRPLPFDMIVFDEITKVKSARIREGAERTKDLIKVIMPHMTRRVGLTGTPLPNGYMDLFGQYLMLDDGQRLGRGITQFKERWFRPTGYQGYKQEVTERGKQDIHTLISDITIEMKHKDYLDLPPVMINEVPVQMPAKAQKEYDRLEKEMFLELDSGATVEIFNAGGLSNKCLQFANGAVYTGEPGEYVWEDVHKAKLDALEEIIEEAGSPVLLSYNFRHDAERIGKRFKDSVHLNRKVNRKEAQVIIERWNKQEIPLMYGHAASIGHGLNLQYGCWTEVFYGLPWSLELYEQFYARVMERQGQTRPGIVHHLLTQGTLDYAVLTALAGKRADQSGLREAINQYRRKKYGSSKVA